jgi:hypothetical protein
MSVAKVLLHYVISGFCCGISKIFASLGCYAVLIVYERQLICSTFKVKQDCLTPESGTDRISLVNLLTIDTVQYCRRAKISGCCIVRRPQFVLIIFLIFRHLMPLTKKT